MIVVDTNIIAYLTIGGAWMAVARAAYLKDPEWAAPNLWRSEFRNVLSLYMRKGLTSFADALRLAGEAENLMSGRQYIVESGEVLDIAHSSKLSAYDSEFIALAKRLGVSVLTTDQGILKAYPKLTRSLESYVKQ